MFINPVVVMLLSAPHRNFLISRAFSIDQLVVMETKTFHSLSLTTLYQPVLFHSFIPRYVLSYTFPLANYQTTRFPLT